MQEVSGFKMQSEDRPRSSERQETNNYYNHSEHVGFFDSSNAEVNELYNGTVLRFAKHMYTYIYNI